MARSLSETGSIDPDRAVLIELERGAAAEPELLDAVVLALAERHGVVEAQRTEWRLPDQTDTNRRTDDLAIIIDEAGTGSGARRIDGRGDAAGSLT